MLRVRAVLRPEAGGLAVRTALAMVVFAEAWADPASSPNGGGVRDGALFLWCLRWTPLCHRPRLNPLHGTHLNVPDGVNLMWNTSLPLPGALMGPVTATAGLPVTTLYTLALALSAWFASIAFRRYVRSYPAALLGGLIYGFSPAMIAQSSSHLHLTLGAVLPPLLLLLLDDVLVRQRRSPWLVGTGLGLMAGAQLLIGEELLAFTGIAAAAMLVAQLVLFPRRVPAKAGHAVGGLAAAAVVFAVLAAWPLATSCSVPSGSPATSRSRAATATTCTPSWSRPGSWPSPRRPRSRSAAASSAGWASSTATWAPGW
jgi:hypothetical protein